MPQLPPLANLTLLATVLLAGCGMRHSRRACISSWEPRLEAVWDIPKKDMDFDCRHRNPDKNGGNFTVHVADTLKARFVLACADYFGIAAEAGMIALPQIQDACVRGRPGAAELAARTGLPALPPIRTWHRTPPGDPGIFETANHAAAPVRAEDWPELPPPFDRFVLLISSYAETADARAAVDTLRRHSPRLLIDRETSHRGWVGSDEEGWVIGIRDLTPPSDSGPRRGLSDLQMAGTLLHELSHIAWWEAGGGANQLNREREGIDMQGRFYSRYQWLSGDCAPPLDEGTTELLHLFRDWPGRLDARFIETYTRAGQLSLGDKRPELQLAKAGDREERSRLETDIRLGRQAKRRQRSWRILMRNRLLERWDGFYQRAVNILNESGLSRKKTGKERRELDALNRRTRDRPWNGLCLKALQEGS